MHKKSFPPDSLSKRDKIAKQVQKKLRTKIKELRAQYTKAKTRANVDYNLRMRDALQVNDDDLRKKQITKAHREWKNTLKSLKLNFEISELELVMDSREQLKENLMESFLQFWEK